MKSRPLIKVDVTQKHSAFKRCKNNMMTSKLYDYSIDFIIYLKNLTHFHFQ